MLIGGHDPVLPPQLQTAARASMSISAFVLSAIEPIPTTDSFYEADWRIRRDNVDGVSSIRVLRGYEPQNGVCDPEHAYAFWFDSASRLIRVCERVDIRYSDFADFNGAQVPRHIHVLDGDKTVVSIQINEMRPLDLKVPNKEFDLPSAPRSRSFTAAIEAR